MSDAQHASAERADGQDAHRLILCRGQNACAFGLVALVIGLNAYLLVAMI